MVSPKLPGLAPSNLGNQFGNFFVAQGRGFWYNAAQMLVAWCPGGRGAALKWINLFYAAIRNVTG